MRCFSCRHLGVSGSTNVFVKQVQKNEDIWEARMGIAILGYTNNDSKVKDPFDSKFRDNYVQGFGTTEAKAIEAMTREAEEISKGLF